MNYYLNIKIRVSLYLQQMYILYNDTAVAMNRRDSDMNW